MAPTTLILLSLILRLVNCGLLKTDNFDETVLIRGHRESMKMVNSFFRNLETVLNKDKDKPALRTNNNERDRDMNDEGETETTTDIRAPSFANNYRTKSTKSRFPGYVSKPLFPFPEGIENVLRTLKRNTFNISTLKTVFSLPTTVSIKPVSLLQTSFKPSTARKTTRSTNQWFSRFNFPTYRMLDQVSFRSHKSSTTSASKTDVPTSISSSILTTSSLESTTPSILPNTVLTSPILSSIETATEPNYNFKAHVDNTNAMYSTSSALRSSSVVPGIFYEKISNFISNFSLDKSLNLFTSSINFNPTITSSVRKTFGSLSPLSAFNDRDYTISSPIPSAFKFNMPPRVSLVYKLATDKFASLWHQEMANFKSSGTWDIKKKVFTTPTPKVSQGLSLNISQIKPMNHHHGHNRPNQHRLSKHKQHKHKMFRHRKRRKHFTTAQDYSFLKSSFDPLNDATNKHYEDTTFKTTIFDGRPVYLPVDPMENTTENLFPTASTKPPNQRYYDMMQELDEGYMMIFIIELCRIISVKDEKQVKDVIEHMETVVNELYNNERLVWLGSPLLDIVLEISRFVSVGPIDMLRAYAGMMYHMLRTRKQEVSVDMNSIIDYADLLYNDEEGDSLFDTLREFEAYPDISKSGYLLCSSLIENFLRPYHRLHASERRQALIDSINKEIKKRFPRTFLKAHKRGAHGLSAKETRHWPKLRATLSLETSASSKTELSTSDSESQIHRKLHLRRKKQERRQKIRNQANRLKQLEDKLHRRQLTKYDDKYFKLRRLKPITKAQRRYKVVSSKYHLKPAFERTTLSYALKLHRRPTKSYDIAIRHDINTPFGYFQEQNGYTDAKKLTKKVYKRADEKRQQRHSEHTIDFKKLKEIYDPFDEYFRKGVIKSTNVYLKRIVEASSYSDEENSLKMKLIGALFSNATTNNGTMRSTFV